MTGEWRKLYNEELHTFFAKWIGVVWNGLLWLAAGTSGELL
jgi:hypothetical protein